MTLLRGTQCFFQGGETKNPPPPPAQEYVHIKSRGAPGTLLQIHHCQPIHSSYGLCYYTAYCIIATLLAKLGEKLLSFQQSPYISISISLGTRPFARGRRKGSGHMPTFELSSRNVIMRGNWRSTAIPRIRSQSTCSLLFSNFVRHLWVTWYGTAICRV